MATISQREAPFDLAAYLANVPAHARVRALTVLNSARRAPRPLSNQRWLDQLSAFEWISLRDYLRTAVEASTMSHPECSLRDACRRHARGIYPTFCETLVGRAVFAALRRDAGEILQNISIAYSSTYSHADVRAIEISSNRAVLAYEGVFGLPGNIIAVGAVEGILQLCENSGTVVVDEYEPGVGELSVEWE